MTSSPDTERLAAIIGYHLASVISGNNMPDMSGDPRGRIPQARRRHFDDACQSAADAITKEFGAVAATPIEPVWWRWRFLSQASGWSKWIALNSDEVAPFRELQGQGIEEGRVELEPLYAGVLPTPFATAGARMTDDQKDAAYAAYLGICVLQTMCRKAGLWMAVDRSTDLLKEMGEAFPFIPERVGLSALRSSPISSRDRA